MCSLGLLHDSLSHDELIQDGLLGVFAPPVPCFLQIAVLESKEELVGILDRCVVKVLFASSSPDPLKHFSAQGLTSNRTNYIAGVLLLAHKRLPFHEDILQLGNVDVAGLACLERCKGILEVILDLVAIHRRFVKRLAESLDLVGLLSTGFVTSM